MTTKRMAAVILTLAICFVATAEETKPRLPTLRPDDTLRSKIAASFRVSYILRDTRDTTLVQTFIQVDKPPTNMAFEMSLRSGKETWPLGPVAWSAILFRPMP